MTYTITIVPEQSGVDKNGNQIKYGWTDDFLDEAGVIHKGKLISIRNPNLFDDFKVGAKVKED